MLFGIKEMKEFAESSDDDRIKAMWKKIQESRSKSAKWCESNEYLQDLLKRLMSEVRPYCRPSFVQYDVFPVFKEAVDYFNH